MSGAYPLSAADDAGSSGPRSPAPPARRARAAAAGPAYRVTVAREAEEVEALRNTWGRLQGECLTTDIDYFLATVRAHPEVERPHVVLLEGDEGPAALAVARLHRLRLVHRLGYAPLYRPRVRSLNVVYGGLLGAAEAAIPAAVGELRSALAKREAELVLFRSVPVGSPLDRGLRDAAPPVRPRPAVAATPRWQITLPGSLEELLAGRSAKLRENVRRNERRLRAGLGDRVSIRAYREPGDLELLLDHVDRVGEQTYQRRLQPLTGERELQRELARVGLGRGWFRAWILYVDDEPAAYWTGFAYRGTFGWGGSTGYDQRYRAYNVGSHLLLRVLADLCRDRSVRVFDFGPGDAHYKTALADRSWIEQDLVAWGRGPKAVRVRVLGAAAGGLVRLGRTLGGSPVEQRLRRAWRRSLGRAAGGSPS